MNVNDETEEKFRKYWTCMDDSMSMLYGAKPLTVAAIDVSVWVGDGGGGGGV